MKALKLITFDVTGTLLRLQPHPAIVYSQCAQDFGINVLAETISLHFKTEFRKLSSEHPNYGCHSGLGWFNWWKTVVKNILIKADPTLSRDDKNLDQLSEFLTDQYKTAKWWTLADGAENILSNIKRAGVPIGVISNYDPRLETLLEAVGIRGYFNFVVTSYDVGAMKPDKRIFRAAEAQISNGPIQPSNCMHVGNERELDYDGAINAGWSAVIIDPTSNISDTKDNTNNHVNHVFTSLHDLQYKLEQTQYKIF